ncbi:hypothetical protein HF078_03195 [Bacillus sp. RO2]|uniref:hypothetical protein n=1 Tax=Bacillus sp. RO2 TaxID=2723913 RepID=UPI00145C414F|nr:hypothetical protein [Bacillus sp. RO2]NMH72075.1 hypothetical protein [Bacillus sp. RO2]
MTNRVKKELISLSIFLVVVGTFLSGWYVNKPDHRGRVGNLEENKFILYPTKVYPEEEPFTPEIYFTKNTKVSGKISSIKDLDENQVVKIWIEVFEGQYIAKKIKITKE